MRLPVSPPVEPMLARAVAQIPDGDGWYFEPKWDGFRCLVFRDGDEVVLGSRGGKELQRYFPEVVAAVRRELPARCVLDGELVIASGDRLDFDLLSQRIHPAQSRISLLAERTPALFVAFDLLALGAESYVDTPYVERRERLDGVLEGVGPVVCPTPVTTDTAEAHRWFTLFEGAGLDGLIGKPADVGYQPGKRVMVKVKHARTADVVVAGFRWHKTGPVVGSLLLGLHDEHGALHHVGVSSAFTAARRAELVRELAPYREGAAEKHPWASWRDAEGGEGTRMPGAPSRWTGTRDLSWEPVRPELVAEVAYDHMEGDRFRHVARFVRWRPDRKSASCTYEQLEQPVRYDLTRVLRGTP